MSFLKTGQNNFPLRFTGFLAILLILAIAPTSAIAGFNYNLANNGNFGAAWVGANAGDQLSFTRNGPGTLPLDSIQFGANVDCGPLPNDLLVSGVNVNSDGFSRNGSVYLIKNSTSFTGSLSLSQAENFSARWSGAGSNDALGSGTGGQSAQLVNVDGGPCPNDLLLTAPRASINGRNMNGAVYLIRDINGITGTKNLGDPANFDAAWTGASDNDFLGDTVASSQGVVLSDLDNDGMDNDLLIAAPYADALGRTDNGAIYLIKDINGVFGMKDLANPNNFTAAWAGGAGFDNIGFTAHRAKDAKLLLNADNGAVDNDLLLQVPLADTMGRTDNGTVYLFRDITFSAGIMDLNNPENATAAWAGASDFDKLGSTGLGDIGARLVNAGDGSYANDLIITTYLADFLGRADAGTIHLITGIDAAQGWKDLSDPSSYYSVWGGASPFDYTGYNYSPVVENIIRAKVVQLVDSDKEAVADDLLFASAFADTIGKTNNGAIYLIEDVYSKPGIHDLAFDFTARWSGGADNDLLGSTITSGPPARLVNSDDEDFANDLLLVNPNADAMGLVDNGAVFLIRDINNGSGAFDLGQETSFSVAWTGGANSDFLGGTFHGDSGVELLNANNGPYANDILIAAVKADVTRIDNGAVYIINEINYLNGWRSLSEQSNADKAWFGGRNNTKLGYTTDSGAGIQLVDPDNDGSKDDLLISSTQGSYGNRTNNGTIHLIMNISRYSGWHDLASSSSYDKLWFGASNSDYIGRTEDSGQGVKLVNADGGNKNNDLLVGTMSMSITGSPISDNGAVYLIPNIDEPPRNYCINAGSTGRNNPDSTTAYRACQIAPVD